MRRETWLRGLPAGRAVVAACGGTPGSDTSDDCGGTGRVGTPPNGRTRPRRPAVKTDGFEKLGPVKLKVSPPKGPGPAPAIRS